MALVSTEEATSVFDNLLETDFYNKNDWSVNSAEDYSKEKEDRDTKAVIDFVESDSFEYIKNLR